MVLMYCPFPTGASTRPLSVVPRPGEEGREGLPEPEGRVTVFEVGRVTVFELVGRVTVLEVVGRVTVFEVGRVTVFELVGRVTVLEVVGRETVFEVGRVTVFELVGRVTVFELVGRVFVEVEDELLSPTDASWVQCVKSRPLVLAIMLSC